MDNFYTSPQLLDILLLNKTDGYGTIKSNRKDLPFVIKTIGGKQVPVSALHDVKLSKGEIAAWTRG